MKQRILISLFLIGILFSSAAIPLSKKNLNIAPDSTEEGYTRGTFLIILS